MKRKMPVTILSLIMGLSIAACGKQETTATTEAVPATVESIQAETTEEIKETTDDTVVSDDNASTSETTTTTKTDYPDSRSDHQANWDVYKKYFDDFSVYGTDTAGKEYNDLPYCGNTGYNAKFLQERTTDKGYTVMYDTNTGKVYYSSMILPTGDGYDEEKSR